jgi:hypothetical protein
MAAVSYIYVSRNVRVGSKPAVPMAVRQGLLKSAGGVSAGTRTATLPPPRLLFAAKSDFAIVTAV